MQLKEKNPSNNFSVIVSGRWNRIMDTDNGIKLCTTYNNEEFERISALITIIQTVYQKSKRPYDSPDPMLYTENNFTKEVISIFKRIANIDISYNDVFEMLNENNDIIAVFNECNTTDIYPIFIDEINILKNDKAYIVEEPTEEELKQAIYTTMKYLRPEIKKTQVRLKNKI